MGDSRAYLYRQKKLKQLTRDHSRVEDLIRDGIISKEEARNHPAKNIINRAVGVSQTLNLDKVLFDIQPGDIFMLCSYGLNNELEDEEIEAILSQAEQSPQNLSEKLLSEALGKQGRDNISVVVAIAG